MTSAFHSKQTLLQGIHSAVALEYADSSARLAATGFDEGDLYKLAIQLNDSTLWLLYDISPISWAQIGNSAVSQINFDAAKATAGTIVKGQAVYIAGYDVGNSRITIELARANSSTTMPAIGIASGTITDSIVGTVITSGFISGLDTSLFSENDALYVSASVAGDLTVTVPTGPNFRQQACLVTRVDAVNGIINVNIDAVIPLSDSAPSTSGASNSAGTSINASRSDHTHEVDDLAISGQAQGDVLYFDGVNWVGLPAGDDGYVLTTHDDSEDPTWEMPSGGVQISAGTQSVTNGTLILSNSNGVSFGINGQTLTASHNGISNINISGGTTSNNLSALVFSNSNNVSFGLNGSTMTATVSQSAQTQSVIQGISAGTQVGRTGDIVFSNSNNVSFGLSGSSRITASYNFNISAGTTSNNLNAITFSNSNGLSFGLDGSTITGSYTVPTQTNQTAGLYALGNTTQNSSTTLDVRSLSFNGLGNITIGYSNGSIQVSGTQTVQTSNIVVPSAGTQTATSGTVVYSNSNNITFGMSGSSRITASYNFNISGGTTSNNLNAVSFNNANNITFGLDAGTMTASASYSQSTAPGALAAGTQTATSGTIVFSNSNGISFGLSGSTRVTASYTVPSIVGLISAINVSAGTTSNNLTAVTFSNLNGLSFGLDGSTITGSYTVPTQTNQTVGLYGLGNTTQNSSTTLDARSISFNGLGNITVGYSNGSVQVSGSQTVQTQSLIAGVYDGVASISTGTIRFSNSNGISFGINGQTITGSHNGITIQTNQTEGFYAVGNTTGQSSSSTFDARTLSISGAGIASVGYSAGNLIISVPAAGASINFSAGTTSNNLNAITFSNSNGLAFGLNGSTITGSYTVPTQTAQTVGLYALGNTTQNSSTTLDARTLSFNGLGDITVGYSNGSIQVSGSQTVQTSNIVVPSAGTQTATSGTVVYSNSNNITFGMSGSSRITASYNFNFSAGTTSNNLNSISFSNGSGVSFGLNAGTLTASVAAQTVQTQSLIAGVYDGVASISTGTIRFTNANGVSFSINGQTISGSVAAQTNQTLGLYALGNTTQNSSTTLDARSVSYNGIGALSVGYSNGSVQLSAPSVSQLSATGAVSISVNADTISIGVPVYKVSNLIWPENPWQTNFGISNASLSLQHFNANINITASQLNLLLSLSGNTNSSGALTVSIGIYTMSQSTMSLASSNSRQISWTSGSATTTGSIYGGNSGVRYRTISLNNWAISAGDYMIGMWFRTTNDGVWRAHGQQGPTIVGALDSNETNHYHHGYSTSSFTTGMVASVNVTNTNYVRTGADALQQPGIIFIGSI